MHPHQERELNSSEPNEKNDGALPVERSAGLSKRDLIRLRQGVEDDRNFIMATWLKGLRYGNDWFELIEASVYYENYQKSIDRVLGLVITEVRVACLEDSPDVILGYSVARGKTLDWVFVKKTWRGIGIARDLVPNDINTVSHVTDVGRSILKKKPSVKFNPFG